MTAAGDRRTLRALLRADLAGFLFFAAWQAAAPFVPLAARAQGASDALIGAMMGAYGLLPLFLAVPAGVAVDRYGARPLLLLGAALAGAALLGMGLVPGVPSLALGIVLVGLAHLATAAAGQAAVLRVTAAERWDHAIGIYFFSVSAGSVVGPVIGGWLAAGGQLQRPFLAGPALSAAAFALAWGLRIGRTDAMRSARAPIREGLRVARENRSVRAALLSSTAAELALAFWSAFFPLLLDARGRDAATIGALFALRGLTMTTVRPLLGRITTVATRPTLLVVSLLVLAAGMALTSSATSPALLALAVVATGVGSGLAFPLTMSLVAEGFPPGQIGLGLGLRLMVNRVGQIGGPFAMGLLGQAVGLPGAFVASAAIVLAAAVVEALERAPRLAAAPAE